MSAPMEDLIRDTLAHRAARSELANPDPWEAFSGRERRHRTQRLTRRAMLGLAVGGLVAATVTGVVPIPAALPVPVLPAGESVLSHTPTRGSLADDKAWLDGLRASVYVDLDWKIFDRSHIKIHFAGDVPGARVAVLTVRMHSGPIADTQTIAVEGPAGARPEEMRLSYKGVPSPVLAQMSGSDQGLGYLLVLAPPGASIRTSLGSDYGQDGRLVQRWVTGKVSDGIAIVEVPASKRAPSTHVVVVKDGRTLYDEPAIEGWGSGDEGGPAVSQADVQDALAASGSSMSWSMAAGLVKQSMGDAILAPSTTTFRIPWTGMLDGQPAALVELAPKDGGRLFYAYHGTVRDQRLLVPAEGADTRPMLWRVRSANGTATTEVAVVASAGTERAQLVEGNSVTPIKLNGAGFATVRVPLGAVVSVKAFGKDDKVLGTTPLREPTSDDSGLPGAGIDTRLVP